MVREVTWAKKTKAVVKKVAKMRSGWRCTVCRAASSNKASFEQERCTGSVRERQLTDVSKRVSDLFSEADGHRRVVSGTVEWCHLCGCFTENRCNGLSAFCRGIPKRGASYGGMWGQRRKLLQGIHPKTGLPLPVTRNMDGTVLEGVGESHRQTPGVDASDVERVRDDGFYQYVPAKFVKVNTGGSKPAQSPFSEILERVRTKVAGSSGEVAYLRVRVSVCNFGGS